jgi:hypothetical protein
MTLVREAVPLAKHHDRAAFDCGDADLNIYLQCYARQNHESGGAKCFVAVPADTPTRIRLLHAQSRVDRIWPYAGAREKRPHALRRAGVPTGTP